MSWLEGKWMYLSLREHMAVEVLLMALDTEDLETPCLSPIIK
jgi:hypothetical protein